MIANLFLSLLYHILISIGIYSLTEWVDIFYSGGKWELILQIVILILMVVAFYVVGRRLLFPQKNKLTRVLSVSLIPLIGLLVAISDFHYRYTGHFDENPNVVFNEMYAVPLWFVTGSPEKQNSLWLEFFVIWLLSFIPSIIMLIGLSASSKQMKNKRK